MNRRLLKKALDNTICPLPKIGSNGRVLLMYLCREVNKQGMCKITRKLLAKRCHIHPKKLCRWLKILEDNHLIIKEKPNPKTFIITVTLPDNVSGGIS